MGEFVVATKSLVIYNRKTLLVQRIDSKEWEFPGGRVEFGEDLHSALRREIKEETGLEDIYIQKLLYAMTLKVTSETQIVGLAYLSYANSDKVIISDEHIDFIWADKNQLIKLLNKRMLNELMGNSVLDTLEID